MCYSERTANGKTSTEVRYFIGSRRLSAKRYGTALRNHWGIENNLHWQLDMTFDEDASVSGINTCTKLQRPAMLDGKEVLFLDSIGSGPCVDEDRINCVSVVLTTRN
jgi:hypothetical protein